jgi:hypothetical protein
LTDEELRFMLIFICFLPYFGDKKWIFRLEK